MNRSPSVRSSFVVLALLGALAGCSGSGTNTVQVTPPHGPVLTCSTQNMTAVVQGNSDQMVSWSITDDSSHGSIDMMSGVFTAPNAMPSPSTATVVATAHFDGKTKGTSLLTLGTAFPSAARPITGSTGYSTFDTGIFDHTVVAKGMRVYSAWPDNPTGGTTIGLKVARSDDGGATWMAPVTAFSLKAQAGKAAPDLFISCPALTIDAGNPDVVYVVGRSSGPADLGFPDGALESDSAMVFAVSGDGGATWTQHFLTAGTSPICPDIASPSANTVVVVGAGWDCTVPNAGRDIFVFSDANQGAGFASGMTLQSPQEYFANGYTKGLDDLNNDPACTQEHLVPESNGGTDSAGDATESPRLFTDGAGHLCVSYIGDINHATGVMDVNVYVQCSSDAGVTWTAPVNVDGPGAPKVSSSAAGSIAPNGNVTVIWTSGRNGGLYNSTSTDGGKTFSTPSQSPHPIKFMGDAEVATALNPMVAYDAAGILWVGYRAYDGTTDQVMVDKSCDGGTTWSGVRSIDMPASGMRYPQFALTPGAAPTLATWAADHVATYTLIPQPSTTN
jgi:hypothetical protein